VCAVVRIQTSRCDVFIRMLEISVLVLCIPLYLVHKFPLTCYTDSDNIFGDGIICRGGGGVLFSSFNFSDTCAVYVCG